MALTRSCAALCSSCLFVPLCYKVVHARNARNAQGAMHYSLVSVSVRYIFLGIEDERGLDR